ncbi:DUF6455 family protein [Falsigemmobacter faecalis]|uniref:DUF6455 domain-containing protein n=1 Tax=Falsigemmobacter faecalis TaxID=2488730 RepID=A0A3P3DM60_9RHOB|nr:DUF6455 family protein [Falsigemmobacter faecalis]RRH74712.1 hypothetical protein EG244_09405 [Falsigemmobacter faecalis]
MKLFRRPDNDVRMNRMAKAVGLDLQVEAQQGRLAPAELRLASHRCGECGGELECRIWLQARQDQAANPPGYCPNTSLYRDLKSDG